MLATSYDAIQNFNIRATWKQHSSFDSGDTSDTSDTSDSSDEEEEMEIVDEEGEKDGKAFTVLYKILFLFVLSVVCVLFLFVFV